nr:Tat pathway signal protein [Streptomyces sp. SID13726]
MDDHHAAVVYAPRTFTNKPDLMMGGAFTAVVNLDDGGVTKLPFTASLAYFDPTCNPATHTAAFTALRDTKTRLVTVDTKGATVADTTAKGEITSAVPTGDGVIAAAGNRLVHVDRKGRTTALTATRHAPYGIRVAADGTVGYLDRTGDTDADVQTFAHGRKSTVASGRLTAMNLRQGTDGKVYLTGKATRGKGFAASGIKALDVAPDAEVSTRGRLAVDPVLSPAVLAGVDNIKNAGQGFTRTTTEEPAAGTTPGHVSHTLTITGTAAGTGRHTRQAAPAPGSTAGSRPSPALTGSAKPQLSTMSTLTAADDDSRAHDPVDTDAWCSVPRNDTATQALQPTPNQVEWAVDMAVRGDLRSGYLTQGGWRSQTGISTIDPQGMFPVPTLNGTSGRIPAQVELGILAQESNLWQAESGAIPGQMGSPLAAVDGYYGHQSGGTLADYWTINWDKSDCGYGVGQVTDGMRKAGYEKEGETSLPVSTQRAVALDYATNIAASLHILADKWNEVHESGQTITVNNDDPAKPENWFAAVWNYNLGFNKKADEGTNGNWGLGWYNNPANPVYPASRLSFMNTDMDPLAAKDAAHPQNWPYEEKVMGWAAWSIDTGHSYATSGRQDWPGESGFSSAGFRPAYWNGTSAAYTVPGAATYNRAHVSPPLDTFCNSQNNCDTANPPDCPDAACYTQYWWNASNATWKSTCASTCGFENIKYQTLVSEPGRGSRLQYGTPVCSGAPAGSYVVDSVPAATPTWSDCGTTTSDGSFQFTFYPDPNATGPGMGQYDAKADLHQIGGGYQGHFWYAHTRDAAHLGGDAGRMTVLGTWKLNGPLPKKGARIYVHVPDTGAQATDVEYSIPTAVGTTVTRLDQSANDSNKWVDIGAYRFNGTTPQISLSNSTDTGTGDKDVAWDAVAFVPVDEHLIDISLPEPDATAPNPVLDDYQEPRTGSRDIPATTALRATPKTEGTASSTCKSIGGGRTVCMSVGKPGDLTSKEKAKVSSALATDSTYDLVTWCGDTGVSVGNDWFKRYEACLKKITPISFDYYVEINGDPYWSGGAKFASSVQIKLQAAAPTFQQKISFIPVEFTEPSAGGPAPATEGFGPLTMTPSFGCAPECSTSAAVWEGSNTWQTNGTDLHSAYATYTNEWTGQEDDKELKLSWEVQGQVASGTTPVMLTPADLGTSTPDFDVRCDRTAGTTTSPGCVFEKYVPTYVFNSAKYPAAAAHAWLISEGLPGHPGSKSHDSPLFYLPQADKNLYERDPEDNRQVVCPDSYVRSPQSTLFLTNNPNDRPSCDEFPFAATYQSAGMPAAMGGTNPSTGDKCVQTVATRSDSGQYKLYDDDRYDFPKWNEVCGRSSMSGWVNSGSMARFPKGFVDKYRLMDTDEYFIETPGFSSCSAASLPVVCTMAP